MLGGFPWYSCTFTEIQEEIEDTKEVIRIIYRKRTDNTKSTKEQTTIYKTLHRKLKIE
jgi:hypothetical protein